LIVWPPGQATPLAGTSIIVATAIIAAYLNLRRGSLVGHTNLVEEVYDMGLDDHPASTPGAQDLDLEVRKFVYDRLIEHERTPRAEEIATALGRSLEEIRASFARMKDAHVLVLQQGDEEVLMANPFSAVPTPFVVRIGDRSWWGNCIWDALGIAAMVKGDATITTGCADCGYMMVVRVENEAARFEPQDGGQSREGIIHFSVPAARWWDNITFT
jgi:hypothetical protein